MSFREIIANDKTLVTYRPALREIGGSVAGTVLLQQIIYWDEKSGGKFFKFSEPCGHKLYKAGDSWEEELGMSAKELRTALSHFAFKCGKKNKDKFGEAYDEKRKTSLVQYYTDSQRVTWYLLNREVLSKLLLGIYKESDEAAVTSYTETTQETTTDISNECKENQSNPKPSPSPKKVYVPPPLEVAVAWAEKEGHPVSLVKEAWNYYERLGWKDSRGTRVKAWKQKFLAVWLTPEKVAKAKPEPQKKRVLSV